MFCVNSLALHNVQKNIFKKYLESLQRNLKQGILFAAMNVIYLTLYIYDRTSKNGEIR